MNPVNYWIWREPVRRLFQTPAATACPCNVKKKKKTHLSSCKPHHCRRSVTWFDAQSPDPTSSSNSFFFRKSLHCPLKHKWMLAEWHEFKKRYQLSMILSLARWSVSMRICPRRNIPHLPRVSYPSFLRIFSALSLNRYSVPHAKSRS